MQVYSPKEARKMILAGTAHNNMTVNGDLDLSHSKKLKKLPDGLKVLGNLYLVGCPSLKELPDGLKVEGWL
jgi:hypothetical protein